MREFGNNCLLNSLDKVLEYGDVLNIMQADERDRLVERKEVPYELLGIIDSSNNYETFVRRLNNWANYRLEGGVISLPEGLQIK